MILLIREVNPLTIYDFLSNLSAWSIILFVLGLILLIIEMLHPGFGLPGGLGIVCMIVDVCITAKTWTQGLILTAVILALIAVLVIVCIVLAQKGKLPGKLILKQSTDRASGFTAGATGARQDLLGKTGLAATDLRPAGIADFDGQRLDVVTQGGYVARGETVLITALEGNRIVVKPVPAPVQA